MFGGREARKLAKCDCKAPQPTRRSLRLLLRAEAESEFQSLIPIQDQCRSGHGIIIPCKAARAGHSRRTVLLPEDIIFNILVCVPAQILYNKMRYVCRAWSAIIRSPAFLNAHLINSTNGILIHTSLYFNTGHSIEVRNGVLEVDVLKFMDKVLTTCRGLVVYVSRRIWEKFYVANPISGEMFSSPCISEVWSIGCGLGYASASSVFKLVVVTNKGYRCAIITIGVDDAWRHLDIPGRLPILELDTRAISIASYIYWIPYLVRHHCIVQFDVKTETLLIISVPLGCQDKLLYYLDMDGSLSFVDANHSLVWDVWLLTKPKDGTRGWTNLFKIDLRGHIDTLERICSRPHTNVLFCPVGWLKIKDEFLLFVYAWSTTCFTINLTTGELVVVLALRSFLKGKHMRYFFPHVSSLVTIKQL